MSMSQDNSFIAQLAMQSPYMQSLCAFGASGHNLSNSYMMPPFTPPPTQGASGNGTTSGGNNSSAAGAGAYVPPFPLRSPTVSATAGNLAAGRWPSQTCGSVSAAERTPLGDVHPGHGRRASVVGSGAASASRSPFATHPLGSTASLAQMARSVSLQSLQLVSPCGESHAFPSGGDARLNAPLQTALVPPAGRTPLPMYVGEYILEGSSEGSPTARGRQDHHGPAHPLRRGDAPHQRSKSSNDGSAAAYVHTPYSSASLNSQNDNPALSYNGEQPLGATDVAPPAFEAYAGATPDHGAHGSHGSVPLSCPPYTCHSAYYQPLNFHEQQAGSPGPTPGQASNGSTQNNSIVCYADGDPSLKSGLDGAARSSLVHYTGFVEGENTRSATMNAVNQQHPYLPPPPLSEADHCHRDIENPLAKSAAGGGDAPWLDRTARPRTTPTKIIYPMAFADDSTTQAQCLASYIPPPLSSAQQAAMAMARASPPSALFLPQRSCPPRRLSAAIFCGGRRRARGPRGGPGAGLRRIHALPALSGAAAGRAGRPRGSDAALLRRPRPHEPPHSRRQPGHAHGDPLQPLLHGAAAGTTAPGRLRARHGGRRGAPGDRAAKRQSCASTCCPSRPRWWPSSGRPASTCSGPRSTRARRSICSCSARRPSAACWTRSARSSSAVGVAPACSPAPGRSTTSCRTARRWWSPCCSRRGRPGPARTSGSTPRAIWTTPRRTWPPWPRRRRRATTWRAARRRS
ncbi:hypothetical protein STCU_12280 [Strigomonas culicis]|uniref:Uncharacterized protein n=1 Tax=Strigomonas culicis TaxID=28005 RepID=S9UXC9_9TRYP|nr:hypothetical protein STCU_12280 [Strigomonas culicis]|eukprot:EPY15180.1 hypothetical protein STCU_12280 [Strigomonas culicis]